MPEKFQENPFYLAFEVSPTILPPPDQLCSHPVSFSLSQATGPSQVTLSIKGRCGPVSLVRALPAPWKLCLPDLCHDCPMTSASGLWDTARKNDESVVGFLSRPMDSDPLVIRLLTSSPVPLGHSFFRFQVSAYSPHSLRMKLSPFIETI